MIVPPKLKQGDEIRIIAPARSLSLLSEDLVKLAKENFENQGFKITFSKNCKEKDTFTSSSIKSINSASSFRSILNSRPCNG